MRILKCIGGKRDGFMWAVEDKYRVNDFVRIPETLRLSIADFMKSPREVLDETIAANYLVYKISTFHFSKDDRYDFLIPEDWTNKQAVLHQFAK